MAENKVEIKVTADTGQAVSGLAAVEKGLKGTGSSAVELGSNAAGAGKGLVQVGQGADSAAAGLAKAQTNASGLGTAFGQLGPLIAGAFTGRELVQTITQADSLQRGMVAIAGSTETAAAEMAFIKKTSNELGLEMQSTGKAYLSLTAATKGTTLEGQATRDVFTSVSRAMSVLGRSTAETENALRAVSQIASKGTVSMEELRGQLGEALPGAMKAAADGMHVTTQELIKMVESGGVLAKDLLPALSTSLDNLYANGDQTDSLVANFNRFKNSVSEVAISLGESGLTKALADVAIVGAQTVGVLGKAFVDLGKGIGKVAGAVATLDFKPLADDLGLTDRAAGDLEQTLFDAMGNIIGVQAATVAAGPALADMAVELVDVGRVADAAGTDAKAAFRKFEIGAQNAEVVLSQTAKNSVAEFDKLKAAGDTAAEAVAKIGKGFDLSTIPGIKDAAGVLEKLAADGKITALQFNKAWTDSLKGVDLADFAAKAKKAFEGSAVDAGRLQAALDQGVRESIKRAGLDFDVISGGMGKAARSAINDTQAIVAGLEGLKKQGVDTGQVLTASISKSINAADSQKAIDQVKAQIESLRAVLGDKLTDGLLDQAKLKALELKDALDKAKPGINSLREAMAELGLKSRDELQATANKATAAFDTIKAAGQAEGESYAAWQARKAQAAQAMLERVIAANGGVASEADKSRAAMEGFEVSVDAAGKATVRLASAAGTASGAIGGMGNSAQASTADMQALADAIDKVNAKYGQSKADREGKYDAPKGDSVTGNTREDRLKGQAATDGTGAYALRAKQRAGTLSADDLKTAEAVLAAAEFNKQMLEQNATAYSVDGTRSVLKELNSAKAILEEVKAKQRASAQRPNTANPAQVAAPATAPAPTAAPTPAAQQPGSATTAPPNTNNIYMVKLDFGTGRTQNVNVASANDAKTLISALQQAKAAAGF